MNSTSLQIKLNRSYSSKFKREINSDLNLENLKANECSLFKNTVVKTVSTLIIGSSESKMYEKYIWFKAKNVK